MDVRDYYFINIYFYDVLNSYEIYWLYFFKFFFLCGGIGVLFLLKYGLIEFIFYFFWIFIYVFLCLFVLY